MSPRPRLPRRETFLAGSDGVRVLDRLTATALDRTRPAQVRHARDCRNRQSQVAGVSKALAALSADPDPLVAAVAKPVKNARAPRRDVSLEGAAQGRLPDDLHP